MTKIVDRFTHDFTKHGDPYRFKALIRAERATAGATCFEITMRIYDMEPYLHKWIDAEGNEVESERHSYYERVVSDHYNLPGARKWITDNLNSFIKNHRKDDRWAEPY